MCRIEIVVSGTITISVWAQCRQRRLRFCLIPLNRVAPSEVPSEKARPAAWVGAAKANVKCALSFRAQPQRTHRAPFSLKQLRCPECGAAETLNCHSKLYGNDPERQRREGPSPAGPAGVVLQPGPARRLWAELFHFPGRGAAAPYGDGARAVAAARSLAGRWFHQSGGRGVGPAFCAGDPLPSAASAAPAVWRRCARCFAGSRQPPASSQTDPLLQTAEHLRGLFPKSICPCRRLSTLLPAPALGVRSGPQFSTPNSRRRCRRTPEPCAARPGARSSRLWGGDDGSGWPSAQATRNPNGCR